MNDYKELVETLRNGTKSPLHVTPDGFMAIDVSVVNALADIIEQYVNDYEILAKMYAKVSEELCIRTKERDAAVSDFNQFAICAYSKTSFACEWCKHQRGDGGCQWFIDHKEACRGNHFEWRGVMEDNE